MQHNGRYTKLTAFIALALLGACRSTPATYAGGSELMPLVEMQISTREQSKWSVSSAILDEDESKLTLAVLIEDADSLIAHDIRVVSMRLSLDGRTWSTEVNVSELLRDGRPLEFMVSFAGVPDEVGGALVSLQASGYPTEFADMSLSEESIERTFAVELKPAAPKPRAKVEPSEKPKSQVEVESNEETEPQVEVDVSEHTQSQVETEPSERTQPQVEAAVALDKQLFCLDRGRGTACRREAIYREPEERVEMDKAFEYRIYPSQSQQELLQKTFGCCRWVYNKVLALRQEEYEAGVKARGINSYITLIPQWKKSEAPWLSEADSMALQQSLRDLDKAYKNFFRNPGKVGFPRFKSKHASRKSYRTNNIAIVDDKHIKLPKLGLVKARISRPTEGRILSATVKQVASGKYYVTVCCTDAPASQMPQGCVEVMGIDAGVHDLMVRSDGVKVANPKSLAKAERRLAREQRRLSRKQKGSANRAKQRRKVALVHEKVANRRKDAIHKATTSAVCESQAIAVEDLNVGGMVKNRHLAEAVSDASMSEMIRQLEYKCAWHGRGFVKVGRFYPSSKTCGCCGAVFDGLTLAMREWECHECGAHHDRDLNAARNIAAEGKRILKGTAGHAGTGAKAPTLVEQA